MTVDPALLAAAAAVAGQGATRERLEEVLVNLALMAEEGSPTDRRLSRVLEAERFVAVLLGVKIEATSTRAVLRLAVEPGANAPEGIESIRTDRTDNRDGARMARRAQGLVGHRVVVFKAMEEMSGRTDRKVRVAAHLVDLGPADAEAADQ